MQALLNNPVIEGMMSSPEMLQHMQSMVRLHCEWRYLLTVMRSAFHSLRQDLHKCDEDSHKTKPAAKSKRTLQLCLIFAQNHHTAASVRGDERKWRGFERERQSILSFREVDKP
ncbi:MAG: hypothetical protein SGPRY_008094 [Prymnesium sp.]